MHIAMFVGATAGCNASAGATSTLVISSEVSDVTEARPMRPGWRDVRDRVRERETDPAQRRRLTDARKRMAHVLSQRGSLTFLRLERGLSKRDLAALSAIPESVLSRVEAGTEDPRLSVCCRLAQALDLSLEAIAAAILASGRKDREHAPRSELDVAPGRERLDCSPARRG